MSRLNRLIHRLDLAQQRSWLAFPIAVRRKFDEDRGGTLGAAIAFHGFFSIFPLMLALVTLAGFALQGDPALQRSVTDSALRQFPVVGADIGRNVRAIQGSVLVVVVGVALALWSGMRVVSSLQQAMDQVWDVPLRRRPNAVRSRLRGAALLLILGLTVVAGAVAAGSAGAIGGSIGVVLALLLALTINMGLFVATFTLTTVEDVSVRDVLPGAIVAGVAWTALQGLGGYLVERNIRGASDVYGLFAVVIGLLGWIYLGAQLTLFCAEINVVRARHLWPRSLTPPPVEPADRRALSGQAREQEATEGERIQVTFDERSERPV